MLNGKRVLGLVTARGGSKGLPGKNIRPVGGKPLIAWTIDAARASARLDRLVLSSDDDAIIDVARRYGCEVPFKRASSLAADDTPSVDVVVDALQRCGQYDWVVLLQPTSPLRTPQDIDAAIEYCIASGAPLCVSICVAEQSPYWMYRREVDRLVPVVAGAEITRRQDLPIAYVPNGAIYVADVAWFMQHKKLFAPALTVGYEMPAERSVDIDDLEDIERVESILSARKQ
jgi:CMP-N,N'-diacetyllegionaminic acid synthase